MSKERRSTYLWAFYGSVVVLLSWLAIAPSPILAQAGNNAVFGSSGPTGSAAWIDASVWSSSGDLCAVITYILSSAPGFPTYPSTGAVIDARGIVLPNGAQQTCSSQPWAPALTPSGGWPPATILLPAGNIQIKEPWIIPNNTRIIGQGRSTILIADGIAANGDMIDMGISGCTAGSNISIEHLKLFANSDQVNGIVNNCAQDGSYVDDVNLYGFGLVGLTIGAGATGSGPYTRLNYDNPKVSPGTPVCVIIKAQTLGLHGITCVGNLTVAGSPGHAAIYLDASNNTIEDVHFEGFWDGIEVGDSAAAKGNTIINVHGASDKYHGNITTVVHVCGPSFQNAIGQCANTNEPISDLTILQVRNDNGGLCTTTVQDDLTGTTTTIGTVAVPGATVGKYVLGEPVSGFSVPPYSRFAIDPSSVVAAQRCLVNGVYYSFNSSAVPTWGSGSAPLSSVMCTTPGALFSNTAGTSTSNSIYVCSGGNWLKIFP
ncbi:MAG TPA: hypothetical protein VNZ03_04720 [Terriglobales bacterium]|jgi:hypothetical protein|nr:hypothetical protein [Terriglobales bacterium]